MNQSKLERELERLNRLHVVDEVYIGTTLKLLSITKLTEVPMWEPSPYIRINKDKPVTKAEATFFFNNPALVTDFEGQNGEVRVATDIARRAALRFFGRL